MISSSEGRLVKLGFGVSPSVFRLIVVIYDFYSYVVGLGDIDYDSASDLNSDNDFLIVHVILQCCKVRGERGGQYPLPRAPKVG